jgi:hypothetical protein
MRLSLPISYLVLTLFFSSTVFAAPGKSLVGFSANLGLGYGLAEQKFGETSFSPKSIGGHLDIQLNFWKIILGLSHLNITNYNFGEERNYVGMGAVHMGLNLTNSVQIIGGVGAGKWRRRRENQTTAPFDYDYTASGGGSMGGVRIFLLNSKKFSLGISGTYYKMTTDQYKSVEDGVSVDVREPSEGSGVLAAIVLRLSVDDMDKLKGSLK